MEEEKRGRGGGREGGREGGRFKMKLHVKSRPRQLSVFFSLSAFGLCLTLSCLPLYIHVQDLILYSTT